MLLKRIIPTLILKNGELIHRQNFDRNTERYVGDPINTINVYNQYLVDEVIILDIENSKFKKPINFNLLKDIAGEAFFPLTYGGGITNVEDAQKIISIGYEKISINNSFFINENLICELSKVIGAQSIVVSIDIIRHNNKYYLFDYLENSLRKIELNEFLHKLKDFNFGELMITSVDLDGTMNGCDLNIISETVKIVGVPVIYKGGLSSLNEIQVLFKKGVSAVASSTYFIMKKKGGGIVLNYLSTNEKTKYENL
tara:strand:- start:195 stop:959 length:765 start_codon:yes stop_codon:yes gene_type:complete